MSQAVLDASAVLAYLWKESGWERVEASLTQDAVLISCANVAEVISKAVDRGVPVDEAGGLLADLGMEWIQVDEEQAVRIGQLRMPTRPWGLSLGDRACLALAQIQRARVLTSDRAWLELDLGLRIECIRV